MRFRLLTLLIALAAGCVPVPASRAPDAGAAVLPVFRFFEGRSQGEATLRIAFRKPEPVRVESVGTIDGDTLVLHQTIREGAKPPRERDWRIREVAPGRYTGSLSDAEGPVTAEASPGRLHLSFRMKGGLATEQWLTLSRDGRSAQCAHRAQVRADGGGARGDDPQDRLSARRRLAPAGVPVQRSIE